MTLLTEESHLLTVHQTLLLPPAFALTLYLLLTYLIIPYYRHLRAHSSYTLVPSSLAPPSSISTTIFSRITSLLGQRQRRGSGNAESLLGDEELEEGVADLSEDVIRRRSDLGAEVAAHGDGRLSRELERGFRDSSDDEEEPRGTR